jgi:ribosomal protein S19
MARSLSKLIYVHRSQFPRFFYNSKKKILRRGFVKLVVEKTANLGAYYYFWKRNSVINRKMLNKKFGLYNGFIFHVLRTDYRHQGFKLGEFSVTRRSAKHKGKQRQLKKRDKSSAKVVKINKYAAIASNKFSNKKVSNRQKAREQKKNT